MSDPIIEQYLASSMELDEKTKAFNKTVTELKKNLDDKVAAFDKSIEEVSRSKRECSDELVKKGQKVLRQIESIYQKFSHDGYCRHYSDLIEEAFGVILPEKVVWEYRLSISCKLQRLEKVTEDYITFYAEEDLGDGDWASGSIGIPRKYFETDCLTDEEFIAEKCEQLKKLKTRKWIREEQEETSGRSDCQEQVRKENILWHIQLF